MFALIYLVFQSPFTGKGLPTSQTVGPALEVGGTESGTIRKYVWLGAINVFRSYPILGSGPETFAFTFPMYKPVEHNLTSEWDFIYNKAHNEYLNTLANIGILGYLSYVAIIVFAVYILLKSKRFELLAGYVGILVTNFFGFSTVPISLLFFLFPAIAVVSSMQDVEWQKPKQLTKTQWIFVIGVILATYYILHTTYFYWLADIHYSKAKMYNKSGNLSLAKQEILKSLKISPSEALFVNELAISEGSIETAKKAIHLSPNNTVVIKTLASMYYKNGEIQKAIDFMITVANFFQKDPKNYFQLGIYFIKANDLNNASVYLNKAINLKPNYKDARFALGLTYIDLHEFDKAEAELKYILEKIDSKDELTKKYLDEI